MTDYAVTVIVKIPLGEDKKGVVRKYISYPENPEGSGTILNFMPVEQYMDVLDKAKKYDEVKKAFDMLLGLL